MAKSISTTIKINASKEKVWNILTNFSNYPKWNPFIIAASGNLKLGEKLSIKLEGMEFKPKIVAFEEQSELSWLGNLVLPGLFDGKHRFQIKEENGSTLFIHEEKFSGLLTYLLGKSFYTKIELGFTAMNEQLKERAEKS